MGRLIAEGKWKERKKKKKEKKEKKKNLQAFQTHFWLQIMRNFQRRPCVGSKNPLSGSAISFSKTTRKFSNGSEREDLVVGRLAGGLGGGLVGGFGGLGGLFSFSRR